MAGCFHLKDNKETTLNPDIEVVNWQKQRTDCNQQAIANNSCPSFKFNGITFKHEPQLNNLIERRLLSLINAPDSSLWELQQNYLATANGGDKLQLTATILEQTPRLIILELNAEEYQATNTYSPVKIAFINFDKQLKKDIQLVNAIEPDKISTFWSTAQVVYQQWLEFNQLLNNKSYQADWPFIETRHMALLSNGLLLKYDANTLAPYGMGTPTLIIPYNKLEGIVKPHYMPH